MADPWVRLVSFTGSAEVGKLLMRAAADTVEQVSLELGGHAPLIVFDDADLDAAAEQAIASKMRNMGQTCVSVNRLYVHRAVVDEFVARLVARLGSLRVGDGMHDGVAVGPLVEQAAVDKVVRHVEDAQQRGAKVVLGGGPATGLFYPPTVLVDVDETMDLTREETFGPVAPVFVFDTEREVRPRERHPLRARRLRLHQRPEPRRPGQRGASTTGRSVSTTRRSRPSRPRSAG